VGPRRPHPWPLLKAGRPCLRRSPWASVSSLSLGLTFPHLSDLIISRFCGLQRNYIEAYCLTVCRFFVFQVQVTVCRLQVAPFVWALTHFQAFQKKKKKTHFQAFRVAKTVRLRLGV
jgi:hypothetical protein